MGRQAGRQACRQSGRQSGRQAGRQLGRGEIVSIGMHAHAQFYKLILFCGSNAYNYKGCKVLRSNSF